MKMQGGVQTELMAATEALVTSTPNLRSIACNGYKLFFHICVSSCRVKTANTLGYHYLQQLGYLQFQRPTSPTISHFGSCSYSPFHEAAQVLKPNDPTMPLSKRFCIPIRLLHDALVYSY
jgi:hypothetical protein